MTRIIDSCFICRAAELAAAAPWFDTPLWSDGSGTILPGIGGMAPGYVLFSPLAHRTSLRSATEEDKAVVGSVVEALRYLQGRIGRLTYWEHGGAGNWGRSSACIDHAHLHVAPGSLPLPPPPESKEYQGIEDLLSMPSKPDEAIDSYLLLGWSDGKCFIGRDVCISQYFRREWARLLGKPDRWDYALVEDSDITRATIDMFLDRSRW